MPDTANRFARRRLAALALAPLLALAGPAAAQTYCSEPVEPLCATDDGAVMTDPDRTLCLEDLSGYEQSLRDYAGCLKSAHKTAERSLEEVASLRTCLEEKSLDECKKLQR